ncbi:glutaredoxin family protein [Agreia pratensis]|uniref:Glutaredoxin-like domain n=1 Tax=Agreia pratensis TaxID=150121 RepID=A0A1X7IRC9_9MICO|nr:glutaredoxin family protein [Agreia pratensis]SMG17297.1 Glutaredoxin-like domain [Agreia pratensis]
MPAIQLTLLSKPGCHLCDDARQVVSDVLATFPPRGDSPSVAFDEKSILDDPELFDEYVEEIPVVLINGRVHTIWRVDPARLTNALTTELEESA